MNNKIGKFYISEELIDDLNTIDFCYILYKLEFIPLWVSFDYELRCFIYEGISPYFEELENIDYLNSDWDIIPDYKIELEKINEQVVLKGVKKDERIYSRRME